MANTLVFFAEKNVSSFCIAKATHIFAAKISNILTIENTLATTVNKFFIHELVKLTMLWTTGSCSSWISNEEGEWLHKLVHGQSSWKLCD